jgi:tellurite resistance protein TehA-like permease
MKAEPTRQRWLGNILYEGACMCSVVLAVVGVALAWGFYNENNPYWGLISPFMIVVFCSSALICWIIGRTFLYFLAGR